MAMDEGVGRFVTGSKNLLLLHDCDLKILYSGGDAPKFKAIARTETVTAKIHSTTANVPPLFIMVTSNQRLLKHVFPGKNNSPIKEIYESDVQSGAGNASSSSGNKRQHEENANATKMRYLELFVRSPPPLDITQLPTCGTFSRENFIFGVKDRILEILSKYNKSDFHSPFLYLYALSGLVKNCNYMPDSTLISVLAMKFNYNINSECRLPTKQQH